MTTLDRRRGRTLSSSAHGAKPQAYHGPFQRLLHVIARGALTSAVNEEESDGKSRYHDSEI